MTSSLDTAATRPRSSSTTQSGMLRIVTHVQPSGSVAQHPLGRRPARGAHPLPAQVLDLAHAAADRHEQALRRRHVGAGELDGALPVAGDREVVDDDVDLAALRARPPGRRRRARRTGPCSGRRGSPRRSSARCRCPDPAAPRSAGRGSRRGTCPGRRRRSAVRARRSPPSSSRRAGRRRRQRASGPQAVADAGARRGCVGRGRRGAALPAGPRAAGGRPAAGQQQAAQRQDARHAQVGARSAIPTALPALAWVDIARLATLGRQCPDGVTSLASSLTDSLRARPPPPRPPRAGPARRTERQAPSAPPPPSPPRRAKAARSAPMASPSAASRRSNVAPEPPGVVVTTDATASV